MSVPRRADNAAHLDGLEERVDRDESTLSVIASRRDEPRSYPADVATCATCLAELGGVGGRRHLYPFTSCATCGPRWSISTGFPYNRRHTTMRTFAMCGDCASEYDDIDDHRHRAQALACPSCGPQLSFLGSDGNLLASGEEAVRAAGRLLAESGIVAVKALGGFQLLCDGTDERAVALLRSRANRPDEPLSVLFRDREQLSSSAEPSDAEWEALTSPEAPIVLVKAREGASTATGIAAPGSPWIGAMLPSTPLHALLLDGASKPLAFTSGNRPGEPPCASSDRALRALASVADAFLDHDRHIVRPLDDSIVRATTRRRVVLRRARGYVPGSVGSIDPRVTVLALGAQRQSTVTLGHRGWLVPSQPLGDLDSPGACELLEATARDLCASFDGVASLIACDQNGAYGSSKLAEKLAGETNVRLLEVAHHHAHVAAVMAEHGVGPDARVLGLVWDGTGIGDDGTIWGGEALLCHGRDMERVGTFTPFPLLGGDHLAMDPRRAALGLLFEHAPAELVARAHSWWSASELDSCIRVLDRQLAPMCSSVERLFDAVGALIGVAERASFVGQTAMKLERLAASARPDGAYPLPIVRGRRHGLFAGDTRALVAAILDDVRKGLDPARISRRLHEALIAFGVDLAARVGTIDVVLGGSCFENRLLIDGLETRLERAGFTVLAPTKVPANDGGVSVGQAWLAAQHASQAG